jgi:hypothetical protein
MIPWTQPELERFALRFHLSFDDIATVSWIKHSFSWILILDFKRKTQENNVSKNTLSIVIYHCFWIIMEKNRLKRAKRGCLCEWGGRSFDRVGRLPAAAGKSSWQKSDRLCLGIAQSGSEACLVFTKLWPTHDIESVYDLVRNGKLQYWSLIDSTWRLMIAWPECWPQIDWLKRTQAVAGNHRII